MASFGFEPFDDDDAIDWVFALPVGDFAQVNQQLTATATDRKTWAALGLLAALHDKQITLPDGLDAWRNNKDEIPASLLTNASDKISAVLSAVQQDLDQNNPVHNMALEEWQRITAVLTKPVNELQNIRATTSNETDEDEDSGFICAFCGEAINSSELVVMTLSKGGPVEIDLQCHDSCLSQHLQDDLHLLLNNL